MDFNYFLLAIVVLAGVLVGFTVPILIQVSKMVGSLTELISTFSESSKILVSETSKTLENANKIVGTVAEIVDGLKDLAISLKDLGIGAKKLGASLKDSGSYVTNLLTQTTGFIMALKTTISLLAKGLMKKGEHKDDDKE